MASGFETYSDERLLTEIASLEETAELLQSEGRENRALAIRLRRRREAAEDRELLPRTPLDYLPADPQARTRHEVISTAPGEENPHFEELRVIAQAQGRGFLQLDLEGYHGLGSEGRNELWSFLSGDEPLAVAIAGLAMIHPAHRQSIYISLKRWTKQRPERELTILWAVSAPWTKQNEEVLDELRTLTDPAEPIRGISPRVRAVAGLPGSVR